LLSGVLLLDKPVGLSSTQALGRAKWLLQERKAGHTGTLDPFASGLLPLCFGDATKFSRFALDATKGYRATMCLGVTTATGDPEGEVLDRRECHVNAHEMRAALAQFVGTIAQVPPMYSALKRDGIPLYKLARQGLTVEREVRQVTIEQIDLIDFAPPVVVIDVVCSKGTYIRTLAEDVGARLGCGAHLTALRRTRVGELSIGDAATLAQLESMPVDERHRALLPPERLLDGLPVARLSAEQAVRYRHGQALAGLELPQGEVAVWEHDERLIGVGWVDERVVLRVMRSIKNG
jgi:tRNA pseudouridine55 synthase